MNADLDAKLAEIQARNARKSAPERRLEGRISDLHAAAYVVRGGLVVLEGYAAAVRRELPEGACLDTCMEGIEWLAERLLEQIDMVADQSDLIGCPIGDDEPPAA